MVLMAIDLEERVAQGDLPPHGIEVMWGPAAATIGRGIVHIGE